MPHPISATYLDLQEARASAALPAAGAWDAAPLELVCPGFENILLSFTYTRGGAGGAFDFQIEVSPYSVVGLVPAGAQEWVAESLYAPGGVAAGVLSQSRVQNEYVTFQSVAAGAEDFAYGPLELFGTIERIRVTCRESGAVGTPGTLQIEANFS